jgi:5,6-dimethylbenzimidazole synthase
MNHEFSPEEIETFYKVVFNRRDVRRFLPTAVPLEIIKRVLLAAHHAPSVGFMQPWTFVLIRSAQTKKRVKEAFLEARAAEAERFSGARKKLYLSLKLEGIEEAPLNLCVTCDPDRHGPAVLGRSLIPETDVYSTCCAIQNLWLAARVEGLGVGWVSILSREKLREILRIPARVLPVAYLCLGYTERFAEKPELESAGWLDRVPLEEVISYETWDNKDTGEK